MADGYFKISYQDMATFKTAYEAGPSGTTLGAAAGTYKIDLANALQACKHMDYYPGGLATSLTKTAVSSPTISVAVDKVDAKAGWVRIKVSESANLLLAEQKKLGQFMD